jgi:hypothetical protein
VIDLRAGIGVLEAKSSFVEFVSMRVEDASIAAIHGRIEDDAERAAHLATLIGVDGR